MQQVYQDNPSQDVRYQHLPQQQQRNYYQQSQQTAQSSAAPSDSRAAHIPALMSLPAPGSYVAPAPSTVASNASRTYSQAAKGVTTQDKTDYYNQFVAAAASLPGLFDTIEHVPEQLLANSKTEELTKLSNDYLKKVIGARYIPLQLPIPTSENPPIELTKLLDLPSYTPTPMTRHTPLSTPLELPPNRTSVPGLTLHRDNLITAYQVAKQLCQESLEAHAKRHVFIAQLYSVTNGGAFSNTQLKPLFVDLARSLRFAYQMHRADVTHVILIRQEINIINEIFLGNIKPEPTTPPPTPVSSLLSLDPSQFFAKKRKIDPPSTLALSNTTSSSSGASASAAASVSGSGTSRPRTPTGVPSPTDDLPPHLNELFHPAPPRDDINVQGAAHGVAKMDIAENEDDLLAEEN
jgi:hypothetical protein